MGSDDVVEDGSTGGRPLTVRVGTTGGGFYVEDDGVGIPAEERDELLRRDDESDRSLGLTIVREVADAHGRTVGVTAGEAGGARFEFAV